MFQEDSWEARFNAEVWGASPDGTVRVALGKNRRGVWKIFEGGFHPQWGSFPDRYVRAVVYATFASELRTNAIHPFQIFVRLKLAIGLTPSERQQAAWYFLEILEVAGITIRD